MKNLFYLVLIILLFQSCKKDEPTTNNTTNNTTATIQNLICDSISLSSILKKGEIATNVTAILPYEGANGGSYSAISINSSGVNRLNSNNKCWNVSKW